MTITIKIKPSRQIGFALSFLLFVGILPVLGQEFSDTYQALKAKFPEEQVVFNKYYEDVDIAIVGDSLVVKVKHYKEMVHLGEQSSVYAKDQLYSSLFYQIDNIEAATLVPHRKKFKTIKVTDIKETFDKNAQVFYDDTKVYSFIYPAIAPGVHTVLTYNETIKDPRFLGSFFFSSYFPIAHGRFTITMDQGIAVDFKLLHDYNKNVKISKENIGSRVKYTYEIFNSKDFKLERQTPNIKYYTPHLNTIVRSYINSKGKTVNVLSSADDLYAWYQTFTEGLKQKQSDKVRAVVESLVKDTDSEQEKVKKIFYWVQNNIKYIAFEDGMRGLIPHPGAYVCEKRFGDCKDMASLLVNMMHHAGIEAYFTWIGTRDIPYAYSKLPSPLVDNHMIATYIHKGTPYFLDATAQYSPFEFPSSMIQGKEALVAINDTAYNILTVPEIPKEANVMNDTSYFKLEDGLIKGNGQVTLTGYAKVFNSYKLIKTSEKKVKDYLTRLLSRGSNKFYLDHYAITNLENLDAPIKIDYNYSVADYYNKIGNEIYLNLNLDKSFNGQFIEKDRELPLENEYKYTNQVVSVFEIPEGYRVEYLPEDNAFENEFFGYTIKYKPGNGKIVYERSFYVNYLLLQPEDFPKYNEAIKKLSEAYNETIILKQTDV